MMMCTPISKQYVHLENLAAGLRPQDEVHVTVLEQSRVEHSALAQSNIKIGVHVRLVDGRGHIVSWHKPVDEIVFYGHDPAARETCKPRYENAWTLAKALQTAVCDYLRRHAEETGAAGTMRVLTDGVIHIAADVDLMAGTWAGLQALGIRR
jgi:hypothetical protein